MFLFVYAMIVVVVGSHDETAQRLNTSAFTQTHIKLTNCSTLNVVYKKVFTVLSTHIQTHLHWFCGIYGIFEKNNKIPNAFTTKTKTNKQKRQKKTIEMKKRKGNRDWKPVYGWKYQQSSLTLLTTRSRINGVILNI